MNAPSARIDLAAYFARIDYHGAHASCLDTLRTLHRQHTQHIAFENLSPLLGEPVLLTPEAIERKLVHGGRGGYCFEQNHLFQWALEALGFAVTPLVARVLWGRGPDAPGLPPRSHMVLKVQVEDGDETGDFIVDVGFGGLTPTAPLRLETEIEQVTAHEPFRLMPQGDAFVLEVEIRDEWLPLYRFDLWPQEPVDYVAPNWYSATHPDSGFVQHLRAARCESGRRYTLEDRELRVHSLDGGSERTTLTSAAQIREALEQLMHIRVPRTPACASLLARIAQGSR